MNIIWFLAGISCTGFAASSLFFIRFWRSSRDRFFLYFAGATALLALERVAQFFVTNAFLGRAPEAADPAVYTYGFRLVAFVLILIAVIEKNRD